MKTFSATRRSFPFVLLFFCSTCVSAQDTGYKSFIEKQFREYAAANIHEKAFLHTDKEGYVAGEVLWFKLYLVDAATHQPAEMSRVAYVELMDAGNKPVLQAKIAVNK